MINFGKIVGLCITEPIVIELIGDVGAGKTTFVKGLAIGLGVTEDIQSPSFTINREYSANDNLVLSHYDFYRLNEAGVMKNELVESINSNNQVVVIEWSDVVKNTLPINRLTFDIKLIDDNRRKLSINANGSACEKVLNKISL